jgi:hypothetical protein
VPQQLGKKGSIGRSGLPSCFEKARISNEDLWKNYCHSDLTREGDVLNLSEYWQDGKQDWYWGIKGEVDSKHQGSDEGRWTAPFIDNGFTDLPMCTYSAPILTGGKFIGVVTIDINLETCLNEIFPPVIETAEKPLKSVSETGADKAFVEVIQASKIERETPLSKPATTENSAGATNNIVQNDFATILAFVRPTSENNGAILYFSSDGMKTNRKEFLMKSLFATAKDPSLKDIIRRIENAEAGVGMTSNFPTKGDHYICFVPVSKMSWALIMTASTDDLISRKYQLNLNAKDLVLRYMLVLATCTLIFSVLLWMAIVGQDDSTNVKDSLNTPSPIPQPEQNSPLLEPPSSIATEEAKKPSDS